VTPDELLRIYHARYPGATAAAFAGGRMADGRSSYQLLADLPAVGDRVLDLGCGDGHLLELLAARGLRALVGIDMSTEELAAAARRKLPGARLIETRAEALPLPSGSIDWVLSHLAFMLMGEVDAVVGELARVLRPGGRFAAVVGGGPGEEEDAFALFLRLFQGAYDQLADKPPRLGDRRTRDAGGFAALFHPGSGFLAEIEESALSVRLDADGQRVWDILSAMYEMMFVPPDRAAALRASFLAEAGGGQVRCAMRCRLLVATRAT
jgi:ubiquinone/menaquinone biosynthesis C-methylase UbiE